MQHTQNLLPTTAAAVFQKASTAAAGATAATAAAAAAAIAPAQEPAPHPTAATFAQLVHR